MFFSTTRRRSLPHPNSIFRPAALSGASLIAALAALSGDLIAAHSCSSPQLHGRNFRSLLCRIKILSSFFESLCGSSSSASTSTAGDLCFKEFYVLVHRSRAVLDYCADSGWLWLLIQDQRVAGYFHEIDQQLSTILDVLPLGDFDLSPDICEQVEFLRRQLGRSKVYVDPRDEALRLRVFSFLGDFEKGRVPNRVELRRAFVDGLGIRDARACRAEIECLEERIFDEREEGEEAEPALVIGMVALARYCRFALFGFKEHEEFDGYMKNLKKDLIFREIGEHSLVIPKDFCCPISLDLMRDPVVVSSGQTYERESIIRWMEEGRCTCPNSGQKLSDARLVPNRALRSLISQWCAANGVIYDHLDNSNESSVSPAISKAAIGATRATVDLLVQQLSDGSEEAKTIAVCELRFLAKTAKENRSCIAEAGAVPLLHRLLSSPNPIAQENAVTAILNLSILDKNKALIMEENGCLSSIVAVLRNGCTTEARENAAATLFSLSAIHDHKKTIFNEPGAVEALVDLLMEGSDSGKKDAVTALFNLSTHQESGEKMVTSGAVSALVAALGTEGIAEEAAGALALLMRQAVAAEAMGKEEKAVGSLVALMRTGSPRAKENAVAALNEMCRSGGAALTKKVASTPALGGLIQALLFTGTKRARRKAAALARMCQRCEAAAALVVGGGWGIEFALARSGSIRRAAAAGGGGEVSVSGLVSISVPVV